MPASTDDIRTVPIERAAAIRLLQLTQCDSEGLVTRVVWVNPAQIVYITVRADGISHVYLRDGLEMFTIENPVYIDATEPAVKPAEALEANKHVAGPDRLR